MRNVTTKGLARTAVAWGMVATITACDNSLTAPSMGPELSSDQRVDVRELDSCETTIESGVNVWSCFDDGNGGIEW